MSCLSDQLHYVSGTEIGNGSFLNMEFLLFGLLVVYFYLFLCFRFHCYVVFASVIWVSDPWQTFCSKVHFSVSVCKSSRPCGRKVAGMRFSVLVFKVLLSPNRTRFVFTPKVQLLCHLSTHGCLSSATLTRCLANLRRGTKIYWENNGFFGSTLSCTTHIFSDIRMDLCRCYGCNTFLCHVILVQCFATLYY